MHSHPLSIPIKDKVVQLATALISLISNLSLDYRYSCLKKDRYIIHLASFQILVSASIELVAFIYLQFP